MADSRGGRVGLFASVGRLCATERDADAYANNSTDTHPHPNAVADAITCPDIGGQVRRLPRGPVGSIYSRQPSDHA